MIRRLRVTANVIEGTRGIYYHGTRHGLKVDILLHGIDISQKKVIEQGFVIGLEINDELTPIYDKKGTAIAVRVFDSKNVPLLPADLLLIPYYHPYHVPTVTPAIMRPTPNRSEQFAELFRSLRENANIIEGTRGIYYAGVKNAPHLNLRRMGIDISQIKVIVQDFVIGLDINHVLIPIYDKNGAAIAVRASDSKNVPLLPRDLIILPYYKPINLPLY